MNKRNGAVRMNLITLNQLLEIMPSAGKDRAALFLSHINSALIEFDIVTPARQAAFLAQVAHESGSLRYVREIADGSAYDRRAALGNTRPAAVKLAQEAGTTPGRRYRGRGLIQITGYDNYRACSTGLLGDPELLPKHPEMLEMPSLAVRSAAWFWDAHDLNALADRGDFERITLIINGGLTKFAERLAFYERAKRVLAKAEDAAGQVPFPQPTPQPQPQPQPEKLSWIHSLLRLFRR